jgi:multidrug resistance protein
VIDMAPAAAAPNKYLVLFIVSLGTVLSGYVVSSLDIALTNIMNAFGFTMDNVTWVLLAYSIPYGATLPIMGKLGDQFGRKKLYVAGLAVFTVATMLVGLAWSSASVIAFRILQGLGAAMFFPNAMTLVADAFPPNERGQAMGMWGAFAAAGAVLGPTVGGYIVQYVNWRMLFDSIVPISAAGIILAVLFLRESPRPETAGKIDYLGGITLVTGLSALIVALSRGGKEGWTSAYILGLFAVTVLGLAAFVYIESRAAEPLVDPGLFRSATFTVANVVGFITFMALLGGLFLIPFFLRNILGSHAHQRRPRPLPAHRRHDRLALWAANSPTGRGEDADHAGHGNPGGRHVLLPHHDRRHVVPLIAVRLALMGAGLALTMSPLSNAAMATLPSDKTGVGSGVFNLFRNVGGSVGIAIFGTLLDERTPSTPPSSANTSTPRRPPPPKLSPPFRPASSRAACRPPRPTARPSPSSRA